MIAGAILTSLLLYFMVYAPITLLKQQSRHYVVNLFTSVIRAKETKVRNIVCLLHSFLSVTFETQALQSVLPLIVEKFTHARQRCYRSTTTRGVEYHKTNQPCFWD